MKIEGMPNYDIQFHDVQGKHMDMRPYGAVDLIHALADCAEDDKPLTRVQAADAHNYICALEAKVSAYYHEAQTLKTQSAERIDWLLSKRKSQQAAV